MLRKPVHNLIGCLAQWSLKNFKILIIKKMMD